MLRVCEDGKLQAREPSGLDPAEGKEAGDFDPAVLNVLGRDLDVCHCPAGWRGRRTAFSSSAMKLVWEIERF